MDTLAILNCTGHNFCDFLLALMQQKGSAPKGKVFALQGTLIDQEDRFISDRVAGTTGKGKDFLWKQILFSQQKQQTARTFLVCQFPA